jgi:hypothetical protein
MLVDLVHAGVLEAVALAANAFDVLEVALGYVHFLAQAADGLLNHGVSDAERVLAVLGPDRGGDILLGDDLAFVVQHEAKQRELLGR